jgi:hypothetical protein
VAGDNRIQNHDALCNAGNILVINPVGALKNKRQDIIKNLKLLARAIDGIDFVSLIREYK